VSTLILSSVVVTLLSPILSVPTFIIHISPETANPS